MTRRRWLAAAAGLVPLVLGTRASAAPFESVPAHASKDDFKRHCGKHGGSFDVGQYSTACTYPDGDVKVCDENGKNCTWHESANRGPAPRPIADPLGGSGPLPVFTEQLVVVEPAAPKGKGKKGSKRRKR